MTPFAPCSVCLSLLGVGLFPVQNSNSTSCQVHPTSSWGGGGAEYGAEGAGKGPSGGEGGTCTSKGSSVGAGHCEVYIVGLKMYFKIFAAQKAARTIFFGPFGTLQNCKDQSPLVQ